MADERLVLRDETGAAHSVAIGSDEDVRVGEVTLRVRRFPDGPLLVEGTRSVSAWAAAVGDTRWVFIDGRVFTFDLERPDGRRPRGATQGDPLTAPMPATVRRVGVAPGDPVQRGDVLIVLEAMKMEFPIRAAGDGVVSAVHCREGELVQSGQELIELALPGGVRPGSDRGQTPV